MSLITLMANRVMLMVFGESPSDPFVAATI